MDNGGANATMLDVGRLLAQRRNEMKRGLRLCFGPAIPTGVTRARLGTPTTAGTSCPPAARAPELTIRVRANMTLSGLELAEAHWHNRPNLVGAVSALADDREALIFRSPQWDH